MSFSKITYDPNLQCSICLNTSDNNQFVTHSGINGSKHPFHDKCIKEYYITQNTSSDCLCCHETINKASLLTFKEKIKEKLLVAHDNTCNKYKYVIITLAKANLMPFSIVGILASLNCISTNNSTCAKHLMDYIGNNYDTYFNIFFAGIVLSCLVIGGNRPNVTVFQKKCLCLLFSTSAVILLSKFLLLNFSAIPSAVEDFTSSL